MKTESIKMIEKAACVADVSLYKSAYMTTEKALAQRQLKGRTHYCDDSTLRYFGARINETRQDDNGLWFALRESVQPPSSKRLHRWVIFDIFGQAECTEDCTTGAAADKLLPALIASKDWELHTREQLLKIAASGLNKSEQIRNAFSVKEVE